VRTKVKSSWERPNDINTGISSLAAKKGKNMAGLK
tara:strand:+ start:294 stop:398 length:105 start_codon:yes stop_codon:yes gene_type:complete